MAESERTPRIPPPNPSPTGRNTPARILDVSAIPATGAYPLEGTATFAPPPAPDGQATVGVGPLDDTDTEPAEHLPQISGYRVLRVISSGGMGTVFKAVHLGLNKVIALKLINSGWASDNDFRVRFEREAKTLGRLDHPNVVPVYDAGSWQGLPYLTMKYIAGKTLQHHLDDLRRDLTAGARVVSQVARAVAYLHAQNIIHRDLKPLNILMTADGVPLVADFGLVRPLTDDSELSLTFVPLGTRPYMSPEQTRGGRDNYTPACDIWALGVILYELLAGSRPFAHDAPDELFRLIRHDPVPPIAPALGAPPGLEAVARKCLQKDPANRYSRAADVADDLDRWLAGDPIEPVPHAVEPVVQVVAPKAATRRPRVLLGGAAVVLALLVAGAVGAFRERQPAPAPVAGVRIYDRLQAGETVVLSDAKGGLRIGYRSVPGAPDVATTQHKGHLALTSAGMCALELDTGPLPPAVRLEAEVAIVDMLKHPWSMVGIFAGRKETPSPEGNQQSLVAVAQQNTFRQEGNDELVTETGALELLSWVNHAPRDRVTVAEQNTTTRVPPNRQLDLVWHKFAIAVGPNQISGNWRDDRIGFLANDSALQTLNGSYQRRNPQAQLPFAPPAFGQGAGLFVHKATAVYRNVRLVPVPP